MNLMEDWLNILNDPDVQLHKKITLLQSIPQNDTRREGLP